jgi:allantoinase
VDVGLIGGVVPGNEGEIPGLFDRGVFAFKCFLVPSGVPEFPAVTAADLRRALPLLAARRVLLMVHAELPGPIEGASIGLTGDPRRYATWLASRPKDAETEAIRLLASLALETGARLHVVHLSRTESVPLIEAARAAGAQLTAETCPHYLTFAAEEIPDGATEFKCAPPIGEAANREGLWGALERGGLTAVVSDHSPCPPQHKHADTGDFLAAWGGIASLQLGLRAVWTGARARGIPFERMAEWMSAGPARLAGLAGRKGAIAPGYDADLVIWDPEVESVVVSSELRQRHPVSPYVGRRLAGAILSTYLRGVEVYPREGGQTPRLGRFLDARAA